MKGKKSFIYVGFKKHLEANPMLPQIMYSCLAFLAIILLCLSSVDAQFDFPNATAPMLWTNSISLPNRANTSDGSVVRALLLRLNPARYGPSFAAGFYCFPPCNSFFLAIYIVYANSGAIIRETPPQVVWSANRDRPVGENATLELAARTGLTLRDSDGSLIWAINVEANRSVAGINITEHGNLVLFDANNASIWQSFDHPTDSLVPGQSLSLGMRIVANSSRTNLTESLLYFTYIANGLFAFVNSDPQQGYYQNTVNLSTNGTIGNSTSMKFTNGSIIVSSMSNPNETETVFHLPPANSVQYMRLESDGHLRIYDFAYTEKGFQDWKIVADLFSMGNNMGICDYPTVCGKYGICNNGQCSCPTESSGTYFVPVDDRQAEVGCSAVTPLTCDVRNHQLLILNNVSYFNYLYDDANSFRSGEDTCKSSCLGNCSCKAAMFLSFNGNMSHGTCFTFVEVYSLKNHQPEEGRRYNCTMYIKVQTAPTSPHRIGLGAILGSIFGALIFLLILIIICLLYFRRGEDKNSADEPGLLTKFTLEALILATENFANKLGEGGFGTVFEGKRHKKIEGKWHEEKIAVKCLGKVPRIEKRKVLSEIIYFIKDKNKYLSEVLEHGKNDFSKEVETVGSIHHINLVKLIGFCVERSNRMLVFEHMSNGSLDEWICSKADESLDKWTCNDKERKPLDWNIRYKIITDIAKGLCYLHEECRQQILHLDIKPENILLDEEFNAKISDFGLSQLIERGKNPSRVGIRGTFGYIAPERCYGTITSKVDVYSFGVVVMEIICGRRNLDHTRRQDSLPLPLIKIMEEKSKSKQLSDLIDKKLGDIESCKDEIMEVMELAKWCLQGDSNQRPSMSTVFKVLEGTIKVESSLDDNFTFVPPPAVPEAKQSAPLLASVLSGPR